MAPNVDGIIKDLEGKSTQDIINWIITNIDISSIIECLKTISPDNYNAVINMYQSRNQGAPQQYPVNYPIKTNNLLEYTKLQVEEISRGTRFIPLAVFDFDVFGVENVDIDDSIETMMKYVEGNMKYSTDEECEETIKIFNGIINRNLPTRGGIGTIIESKYTVLFTTYCLLKGEKYGVDNSLFLITLEEFKDECLNPENSLSKLIGKRTFTSGKKGIYVVNQNYVNFATLLYFKFLEKKGAFDGLKIDKLDLSYPDDLLNFKTFLPYVTRKVKDKKTGKLKPKDDYLYKYTINTGYGGGYGMDPRHIYSDQYSRYINSTLFEGSIFDDGAKSGKKCNVNETSCIPMAYNVLNNKFLVKRIKSDKSSTYEWMNKKEMQKHCKCLDKDTLKELPLVQSADDVTRFMNNMEGYAPPYHTRFYGEFLPQQFWGENPSDLRVHNMSKFDPSIFGQSSDFDGSTGAVAKFGSSPLMSMSEMVSSTITPAVSNPFTRKTRRKYVDIPLDKIPPSISDKNMQELIEIYDRINRCVSEKLGNSFGSKKSLSGMKKLSAMGNVYLLGANFGKTTKYLTLTFDPKTQKWEKSPTWRTGGGLVQRVKSGLASKPTKTGLNNFKKLRDFQIPPKDFSKLHYQSKPIKPSSFGYFRKALEQINRENKGMQLYPLGKGAYLKGRHAGVSSTYSQRDSERLGLWKPRQRVPRHVSTAQFQFGAMRPAGSCFGKSNDYGPIRNGYTGRYMQGIVNPRYGYNGTQGVYGGTTGWAGLPALSDITIRQGLIPLNKKRTRR